MAVQWFSHVTIFCLNGISAGCNYASYKKTVKLHLLLIYIQLIQWHYLYRWNTNKMWTDNPVIPSTHEKYILILIKVHLFWLWDEILLSKETGNIIDICRRKGIDENYNLNFAIHSRFSVFHWSCIFFPVRRFNFTKDPKKEIEPFTGRIQDLYILWWLSKYIQSNQFDLFSIFKVSTALTWWYFEIETVIPN